MGRARALVVTLRTGSVVATALTALVALGIAAAGHAAHSGYGTLYAVLGTLVGLPTLWLLLFGMEALVIDVPAGRAQFRATNKRDSASLPVADLGELHVEVERHRKASPTYRLRVRGIPKAVLLESMNGAKIEARKATIENLVAAALIRPILAVAHGDGGFRSGPDVLPQLQQRIGDDARLDAALALLARDHDATVRANATECARRRSS